MKHTRTIGFLSAALLAGCAAPLSRRYEAGEVLKYEIAGSHSTNGALDFDWHAHAVGTVSRDAAGVFREDVQWTKADWGGKQVERPVKNDGFRQAVSLDPAARLAVPDLSQVDRSLIAPITDLLTFYSDYWLAVKKGLRLKTGDRAYVHYGKPSSWADGTRVVAGYDCIDFDLSVAAVDRGGKTATLKARHVPPDGGCERAPAEWMKKPVADTANNWFEVTKTTDNKYEAGAGKEIFDAEIEITLPSGAIKSATLFNPVILANKICADAALSDCGVSEKTDIVRRISLTREP